MNHPDREYDSAFFDAMRKQIEATPMPPPGRTWSARRLPAAHRRLQLGLLSGASLTTAAIVAVVVLVLTTSTDSTPPAYALTRSPSGSITITLNNLTKGIPALNAKLARLGIDETIIPIKADCHEPGGPSFGHGVGRALVSPGAMSASITFVPGHQRPPPAGFKYIMAAKQLPDGKIAEFIGAIKPPLPSCFAP